MGLGRGVAYAECGLGGGPRVPPVSEYRGVSPRPQQVLGG